MRLNEEQKKLVEDNHNLIYWFARKKHINIEEYYDILAQGLCIAAYNYDSSKGSFSAYSYLVMNTEMQKEHKKCLQKSKIPKENILHYENIWEINNLLPDNEITENKVINKLNYDYLVSKLNNRLKDKDKEVLGYLLEGLTMREIANIQGVSHQCIHKRICSIRELVLKINRLNLK